MPTAPPAAPALRAKRKTRVGIVVSSKMMKTIVVQVRHLVRHPKYNRVIKQTNKFKAHDEQRTAAVGDWVKIMETRPISKDKCWRLVEILKRASSAPPAPGREEEPVRPKRIHKAPEPSALTRPGEGERLAGEAAAA